MPLLQSSVTGSCNISSAALIGSYTADAARESVMATALVTGSAGNGSYTIYLTRQLGGTGPIYKYQPVTTPSVASGDTIIGFQSGLVPLSINDVLKVWLLGLAGDTAVTVRCEIWDMGYLKPTAQDRTLDVSATGEAGLDFDNIKDATGAHTLTNITVPVTTTLTNPNPTVSDIADAVWDEVLTAATHNVATSAGRRLRQLASSIIYAGTVVSATANTVVLDAGADSTDGAYDPAVISIISGVGAGQSRLVLEYDGTARRCIVDRDWKVTPALNDEYMILGDAGREHVNEGLIRAGTAYTCQLNANSSTQDGAYVGQVLFIRSGTGQDQARRVITYDGATQTVTTRRPWDPILDTTSAYVMLPTAELDIDRLIDSIWNEDLTGHTTTGTAGLILAITPTVGQIDTQLSNSHETGSWAGSGGGATPAQIDAQLSASHGTGSWGIFAGTGGALSIVDTITNTTTLAPEPGVTVDLYADAAYTVLLARTTTDALGNYSFTSLAAGTYYLEAYKFGFTTVRFSKVAA